MPPLGVKVTTDLEHRASGIRARARWIDLTPVNGLPLLSASLDEDAAEDFFQYPESSAEVGIDKRIQLSDYVQMFGDC